jgi:nucleotide-binding universal stress UspA family protein
MFKHLLVPLDGSPMAEQALWPAAYLARKTGAKVTLLHSLERDAPSHVHGMRHLTDATEAGKYLQEIGSKRLEGIEVTCHLHDERVRDVSESIAAHVDELALDFIIMCAHGEAGLRRRLFGGVAERVVRSGKAPVLLIRPGNPLASQPYGFRFLLVPDDGSKDHEPGLDACVDLALAWEAQIHLVRVVETLGTLSGTRGAASQFLPSATRLMLEMDEWDAARHLEEHVHMLQSRGARASGDVRRGDPAAVLIKAAEEKQADLLVVRTHGKTGLEAFWSSSLTPRLYSSTQLPMLLVPLKASG